MPEGAGSKPGRCNSSVLLMAWESSGKWEHPRGRRATHAAGQALPASGAPGCGRAGTERTRPKSFRERAVGSVGGTDRVPQLHAGFAVGRPAGAGPAAPLSRSASVLCEGSRNLHRPRSRHGPAGPGPPRRTRAGLELGGRAGNGAGARNGREGDRVGLEGLTAPGAGNLCLGPCRGLEHDGCLLARPRAWPFRARERRSPFALASRLRPRGAQVFGFGTWESRRLGRAWRGAGHGPGRYWGTREPTVPASFDTVVGATLGLPGPWFPRWRQGH